MNSRKRASKPIDIALTEEQIEGIIAEAAARTGLPSASRSQPSGQGPSWVTSIDPSTAGLASVSPVYLPLADVPLPSHAFLPGIVSEDEPGTPAGDGTTGGDGGLEVRESLEVAEHRRNVIRQLRGR